jgi:L-glyceraldehyde 3-phosphate reductase
MAQMALAWVLRHPEMTSVVIGASRVSQIDDAVNALKNLTFSSEELKTIDKVLNGKTAK